MPTATLKPVKPGSRKRLDEQRHDLGVRRRPRRAEQLHPDLRELTRLPAQRLVLAKDVGGVAQPMWAGLIGHPRRDQPSDRHGHLGTQRQQATVKVYEPKRRTLERAGGGLERVETLHDRRFDQSIAPCREDVAETALDHLSLGGLQGQDVAKSSGRDRTHTV